MRSILTATCSMLAWLAPEARAQDTVQLECTGQILGQPGAIRGTRTYTPYNALGDGTVRFQGTATAGGQAAPLAYEGYTRTAPFAGTVGMAAGPYPISVLDATGPRGDLMIVYDARPTMGPPTILAELVCRWSR
jgi:hypothetical protein